MRRQLIAGNWKMYKTTAEALAFASAFLALLNHEGAGEADVCICAPYTQLSALKGAFTGADVRLGAQNMHFEKEGAYTGEISAAMLTEIGVDYCVIGHSERRQYFAETDETVNRKIHAAFAAGIVPIACVGEVLEQRDAGKEYEVVGAQVAKGLAGLPAADAARLVIAYEPVWAIGTGRTATAEQAQEMGAFIRAEYEKLYGKGAADAVRIQYGGSVKPQNAAEILGKPDVDGALVGGASLVPEDFYRIYKEGR